MDRRSLATSCADEWADPESLEWCNFDDEYRAKLDRSSYVSLSRETRLSEEALSWIGTGVVENHPSSTALPNGEQPLAVALPTNHSVPSSVPGDADPELDSEPSDEDTDIPGSLFSYNIPGVLKEEEVAKLDLGHWRLLVRNMLINFEVK